MTSSLRLPPPRLHAAPADAESPVHPIANAFSKKLENQVVSQFESRFFFRRRFRKIPKATRNKAIQTGANKPQKKQTVAPPLLIGVWPGGAPANSIA
jgi:hypothetical protein